MFMFGLTLLMALALGAEPSDGQDAASFPMVVEAADLPRHQAGGLTLIDARPAREYQEGHIQGAIWFDMSAFKRAAQTDAFEREKERWPQLLGSIPTGGTNPVAIYDDGNMTDAARLWFLLQYRGLQKVAVVNGGWPEVQPLVQTGRLRLSQAPPASRPATEARPVKPSPAAACPVRLAETNEVQSAGTKPDTLILDVRTEAEYRGTDQEKNPRHGHLPGAVNLPHTRLLDAQPKPAPASQPAKVKGRLKSPQELQRIFEQAGLKPNQRIVTHCQSGGRAALAALALVRAGYSDVSNYYGSFAEWSADTDLPLVGPPGTRPAS